MLPLQGSLVKAYALLATVVWRQESIPSAYLDDSQCPSYTYEGAKSIDDHTQSITLSVITTRDEPSSELSFLHGIDSS